MDRGANTGTPFHLAMILGRGVYHVMLQGEAPYQYLIRGRHKTVLVPSRCGQPAKSALRNWQIPMCSRQAAANVTEVLALQAFLPGLRDAEGGGCKSGDTGLMKFENLWL